MIMQKFNVLKYKTGRLETYDILPYFRDCWNDQYDKEEKEVIQHHPQEIKCKTLLKAWIQKKSRYMFWARCEYEFLIASWPFGSYRLKQEMMEFLDNNPKLDLDNINQNIKFTNIIIRDMEKIDIHYQIMMNIDVITDILFNEFKLVKKG